MDDTANLNEDIAIVIGHAHQSQQAMLPGIADLSLPEAGGSLGYKERFWPDCFTGAGHFSIPIPIPAARNTVLDLELSYASGGGNGPFGLGFSISLPSITVRTSQGIPRYDGRDTFLLGSQVLVPRYDLVAGHWTRAIDIRTRDGITYVVTAYRSRSEVRLDVIELWVDPTGAAPFWRTVDHVGKTTWFGLSEASRIADPAQPSAVYQWLPDSQIDIYGNKVVYTYRRDDSHGLPPDRQDADFCNNTYLVDIAYGNFLDDHGKEAFAFHVVFDYGERDLDHPTLAPQRPWGLRTDPFSSFRAGFEIRTNRLCSGILVCHFFPADLGPDPVVTDVVAFGYSKSTNLNLLTTVTRSGFRKTGSSLRKKSQPMLTLAYGAFEPDAATFRSLQTDMANPIPGLVDGSGFQLVDLYGDGLPGLLSHQGPSLAYWPPRGDGQFGSGEPLPQFPIDVPTDTRAAVLMDIAGRGSLDLVVMRPGYCGFYPNMQDGGWEPFQPLPSVPTELSQASSMLIDLNGSGRVSLLSDNGDCWRIAVGEGMSGFNDDILVAKPKGVASAYSQDERIFIGFADILGDGLQHLVRVSSGSVTFWPNLGNGRFGVAREIANAPYLDKTVAARNIFLTDLDGTGAADLVVVTADAVLVHRNNCGNCFADAVRISIPGGFGLLDTAMPADLEGSGCDGVLISHAASSPRQLFLDFTAGNKPHLLQRIDNGVGGITEIKYRSSVRYALADAAAGRPWATKLPMPVQVVAEIVQRDLVDNVTESRLFQYRDGYYDGTEREFRGFGMVQVQDSSALDPSLWHFAPGFSNSDPLEAAMATTWSLTGADIGDGAIETQLQHYAFRGDPDALSVPPFGIDADVLSGGGDLVRQAFVALAGYSYRKETYDVDVDGIRGDVPLNIDLTGYRVRLIQPAIDGHDAVMQVIEQEGATSQYEGCADDPRVGHHATVAIDGFGHVLETVEVAYARRAPGNGTALLPGQATSLIQLRTSGTINHIDGGYSNGSGGSTPPLDRKDGLDFHFIGETFDERLYEISGFMEPNGYFDHAGLCALVEAAKTDTIDYGVPFTPSKLQARLVEWAQNYFWNASRTAVLPLQEIAPVALLQRRQSAVLSDPLLATVYGKAVDASLLSGEGGYVAQEGYWWSSGNAAVYGGADIFFQQTHALDPFGNAVTIARDRYQMSIASRTDALGHVASTVLDYLALKPATIIDTNGVRSEAIYDGLGQIMVTALYRLDNGKVVGDTPLAQYTVIDDPTTADVMADPMKYLQGAGVFVHQELGFSLPSGQPSNTVVVERHRFIHPEQILPSQGDPFGLALSYFDGGLRQIAMLRLASGAAPFAFTASRKLSALPTNGTTCFVMERRQRFDGRGHVAVNYPAFLTTSPSFAALPDVPLEVMHYDGLGRRKRLLTAKQFLVLDIFGSWTYQRFDENDSILQSPYYLQHINDPKLPPEEKRALEKAAVFANTPVVGIYDPMGREIQKMQTLVSGTGSRTILLDYRWLDITGNALAETDPRFYNPSDVGKPAFFTSLSHFDMAGQLIDQRNADAGNVALDTLTAGIPHLTLHAADETVIRSWDCRGYKTSEYFNALRQTIRRHVQGNGLDADTQLVVYGNDPATLTVNRVVAIYDEAGVVRIPAYGLAESPLGHSRQFRSDFRAEADWTDVKTVSLEKNIWTCVLVCDALGDVVSTALNDYFSIDTAYSANRRLISAVITAEGSQKTKTILDQAAYVASGEPQMMAFANGVKTVLDYDMDTLRVVSIESSQQGGATLQDVGYVYDPHGNVAFMRNDTPVPGSTGTTVVGDGDFELDSLYRLVDATGRQNGGTPGSIERYAEHYRYDPSGNLTETSRTAARTETMQLAVSKSSNHAVPAPGSGHSIVPDDFFEAGGNLVLSETGEKLAYNSQGTLLSAGPVTGPTSFFQTSWNGSRARRVIIADEGSLRQTLYLDGFVIDIEQPAGATGGSPAASYALYSSSRLLAIASAAGPGLEPTWRSLISDRLWSVGMEIDQAGQLLCFEEYRPFGGTALAIAADVSAPEPRFRFVQHEQDQHTGFYAIGCRYYIAEQGRWTSPDPSGDTDGSNRFMYAKGNPVTDHDINGENGHPPGAQPQAQQPAIDLKYALKNIALFGTLANAGFDASVNKMELAKTFALPIHGKAPSPWLLAGHSLILTRVGATAVFAGGTGAAYQAMNIYKQGFNKQNSLGLVGSLAFLYEGVLHYQAMANALSPKIFHHLLARASIVGVVADASKSSSYFLSARSDPERRFDYLNATGYGLLASANVIAFTPVKYRRWWVRKAMRIAPPDKPWIKTIARFTRPAPVMLAGASALTMAYFWENRNKAQKAAKGQSGH